MLSCFYGVFIVRNEGCNQHCHLAGISRTMELQETCHSPTPSALQSSQPGCASSGKDVQGQQSDLYTSALPAAILIFHQQNCVLYNSFISSNLIHNSYINSVKLNTSICFGLHPPILRRSMSLIIQVCSLWCSRSLQVAVLCTC